MCSVFSARYEEFEHIMRKQTIVQMDTVVKLRGLPWRVTPKEITDFFQGKRHWPPSTQNAPSHTFLFTHTARKPPHATRRVHHHHNGLDAGCK